MKRITPQMDDLRQKMNNLASLAAVAHTFGEYAKHQDYMTEWRRLDAQLYCLEIEQREVRQAT